MAALKDITAGDMRARGYQLAVDIPDCAVMIRMSSVPCLSSTMRAHAGARDYVDVVVNYDAQPLQEWLALKGPLKAP